MRRGGIAAFTLLWLALAGTSPRVADASCVARSPEQIYAATVVFRGQVVDIQPPRTDPHAIYFAPARVTFAVDTRWKGMVPGRIVVTANYSGSASSHVDVRLGQDFLVYAIGHEPDDLRTDGCVGLWHLPGADALLASLGPGLPPVDSPPLPALPQTGTGDMQHRRGGPILAIVLAILAATGAALVRLLGSKRRRVRASRLPPG